MTQIKTLKKISTPIQNPTNTQSKYLYPHILKMLSTNIAGIPLKTCIFNASGPRTGTCHSNVTNVTALFFYDPTNFNTGSTEMLKKIAQSDAGAVLSKSATLKSQKGNPLPRTWKNEGVASLNSEGLPNYVCYFFIFLSEFP